MADAEPAAIDPVRSRVVAEYVERLARDGSGAPLVTAIDPADEMYLYELSLGNRGPEAAAIGYFATGAAVCATVLEAIRWRFRDPRAVCLLDFAGGRGRTTRFLVRHLPASRITVAEIDAAAVARQVETFGVSGLVSASDADAFAPQGRWDVVVACSFFSHLPHRTFARWLARLYGLVGPGGMLLFSVHGMDLLPASERPQNAERRGAGAEGGIVFRASSESPRLDTQEYGTSFVTPGYVRGAAEGAAPDGRLLRFPRGLCGYQDLYVLLRPPLPAREGEDLRLARHPLGALEDSAIENGRVRLEGWAEGGDGERAPDVRLVFGNAVAQTAPQASGPRRKWRFDFPADAVGPDDLVRVEAVSERGLERILVIGTLRPYLPR